MLIFESVNLPTDQQLFNYFRMALVSGFLTPQDVSAWADRQLLSRSSVSEEVIELSLSARLPFSQIIKNLNLYQGAHDYGVPLNLVLAHAGLILEDDSIESPKKIWSGLRLLLAEENLPEEVRRTLLSLEDSFESQRREQIIPVEIQNRLSQFLSAYQEWRLLIRIILAIEIPGSK